MLTPSESANGACHACDSKPSMSGPKYGGIFVRTESRDRDALLAAARAALKDRIAEWFEDGELPWRIAGAAQGPATWLTLELEERDAVDAPPSDDDEYDFWLTHGNDIASEIARSLGRPAAALAYQDGDARTARRSRAGRDPRSPRSRCTERAAP